MKIILRTITMCLFLMPMLPAPLVARPRDHDGDGRAPLCNQAAVNACLEQHRAALSSIQSALAELEPRLASHSRSLSQIDDKMRSFQARLDVAKAEMDEFAKEKKFLLSPALSPSGTLLGGQLELDSLFDLKPLQISWAERYPSERAQLLASAEARQRAVTTDLTTQVNRFLAERSPIHSQFQAAVSQKNSWLEASREHAAMCDGGCKEQLCPNTN